MIHKTFLFLLLSLALSSPAYSVSDDHDYKEYWIEKYGEVSKDIEMNKKVKKIFDRVLAASEKEAEIDPHLVILRESKGPWAFTLPDHSIIIVKDAIEKCYENVDEKRGDARLAFILGHEIAHQMNGDFWHAMFYEGIQNHPNADENIKRELEKIVINSVQRKAKEIQADLKGIIYASIAGFQIESIVSNNANFLEEWSKAIDPEGLRDGAKYPTPEQRVKAIEVKLIQVKESIDYFNIGTLYLSIGMFDEAIRFFNEFKKDYPGREVYSNLGTAHLMKAYDSYVKWKGEVPYKFAEIIDLSTRAIKIPAFKTRGIFDDRKTYKRHIKKAIQFLEEAAKRDPYHSISRNNLGIAYLLEEKYNGSLQNFKDALSLSKNNPIILNNRGVAYMHLGSDLGTDLSKKAESDWLEAIKHNPALKEALNNLKILNTVPLEPEALIPGTTPIVIQGIKAGMTVTVKKLNHKFGGSKERVLNTGNKKYIYLEYEDEGLDVVLTDNKKSAKVIELLVIKDMKRFNLPTNEIEISKKFGIPNNRIPTSTGEIFIYKERGLLFKVDDHVVTMAATYAG